MSGTTSNIYFYHFTHVSRFLICKRNLPVDGLVEKENLISYKSICFQASSPFLLTSIIFDLFLKGRKERMKKRT